MHHRFVSPVLIASLLATMAGCGGSRAVAPSAGSATARTADELPSPPRPWDQMSPDEKKRWMVTAVMKHMGPRFQRWKPEQYASFTCASCHGENPRERNFEMPNPELPALYPTGHPEQHRMVREHPEAVRFMFNEVTKPMMTLLGLPEYDPETRQGFGCFSCHPTAQDEQAAAPQAEAEEGHHHAGEGASGQDDPTED